MITIFSSFRMSAAKRHVIVLGWLGAQQKHFLKYVKWHEANGAHTTSTIPPLTSWFVLHVFSLRIFPTHPFAPPFFPSRQCVLSRRFKASLREDKRSCVVFLVHSFMLPLPPSHFLCSCISRRIRRALISSLPHPLAPRPASLFPPRSFPAQHSPATHRCTRTAHAASGATRAP